MRVLHVLDPINGGDESVLACRAALGITAAEHRVWLVGDARTESRARELGVTTTDRVGAPRFGRGGSVPELASRRLLRLNADRFGDLAEPWADVAMCWSVPALGLARLGLGKRTVPRVGALVRTRPRPGAGPAGLLADARDAFSLHDTILVALDDSVRGSWAVPASARRGRGSTLLLDNIRVAAPPIPRLPVRERAALRASLGVPPGQIAVAFVADPPRLADAMRFMFTVGLLFVGGQRVTGVVPAGAGTLRRAARQVRAHGRRFGIAVTDAPLPDLIGACDLAVWDTGAPAWISEGSSGPTGLATAAALGVPVVAAHHPLAERFLGPLSPVLLARDRTPAAIAARLLPLATDGALRARTGAALRAMAADRAAADPFERTLLEIWREVANVPVARPGFPIPPALARAREAVA